MTPDKAKWSQKSSIFLRETPKIVAALEEYFGPDYLPN